jgi:hypothetical protein
MLRVRPDAHFCESLVTLSAFARVFAETLTQVCQIPQLCYPQSHSLALTVESLFPLRLEDARIVARSHAGLILFVSSLSNSTQVKGNRTRNTAVMFL